MSVNFFTWKQESSKEKATQSNSLTSLSGVEVEQKKSKFKYSTLKLFSSDASIRDILENFRFPHPIYLISFLSHKSSSVDQKDINNLLSEFQLEHTNIAKTGYIIHSFCEKIYNIDFNEIYSILKKNFSYDEVKSEWRKLFDISDDDEDAEEAKFALEDYLKNVKYNFPTENMELNTLDDLFTMHVFACCLNTRIIFIQIPKSELIFTQPIGKQNSKFTCYILCNNDKTFTFLQPISQKTLYSSYSEYVEPSPLKNSGTIDCPLEYNQTEIKRETKATTKNIQNIMDSQDYICVSVFGGSSKNWNRIRNSKKFIEKIKKENQPIIFDRPAENTKQQAQKTPIYLDILCIKSIYDYMFLNQNRICNLCGKEIEGGQIMIPKISEGRHPTAISFYCYSCASKQKISFFKHAIDFLPQIFIESRLKKTKSCRPESDIRKLYASICSTYDSLKSFDSLNLSGSIKKYDEIFNLLRATMKYSNDKFVQFADNSIISHFTSISEIKAITDIDEELMKIVPLSPSIVEKYIEANPSIIENTFCPYYLTKSPDSIAHDFERELDAFDSDIVAQDLMKQNEEIKKYEVLENFMIKRWIESENKKEYELPSEIHNLYRIFLEESPFSSIISKGELLDVYFSSGNLICLVKEDEEGGFADVNVYIGNAGIFDVSQAIPIYTLESIKYQKGIFIEKSDNQLVLLMLIERPKSVSMIKLVFDHSGNIYENSEKDGKIKEIAALDSENIYKIVQTDDATYSIMKDDEDEDIEIYNLEEFIANGKLVDHKFLSNGSVILFQAQNREILIFNDEIQESNSITLITDKKNQSSPKENCLIQFYNGVHFIITSDGSKFLPQNDSTTLSTMLYNAYKQLFCMSSMRSADVSPKKKMPMKLVVFVSDSFSSKLKNFIRKLFDVEVSNEKGCWIYLSVRDNIMYYIVVFVSDKSLHNQILSSSLADVSSLCICLVNGFDAIHEMNDFKDNVSLIHFNSHVKSAQISGKDIIYCDDIKDCKEICGGKDLTFEEILRKVKTVLTTYMMLMTYPDIPSSTVLHYCQQANNEIEI